MTLPANSSSRCTVWEANAVERLAGVRDWIDGILTSCKVPDEREVAQILVALAHALSCVSIAETYRVAGDGL